LKKKPAVIQSQEQLRLDISNQLKIFNASPFKAVQFTAEYYAEAYYGKPPSTFDEFIKRIMDQNRVIRGYVEVAARCGYSYWENKRPEKSVNEKTVLSREWYKPSWITKFSKPSTEPAPNTVAQKQHLPKSAADRINLEKKS